MAEKITLESLDARVESLDARVEKLDARVEKMDARVEKMDARAEKMDARAEKMDARLDKSDARLDRIEADVGTLKSQMVEVTVGVHRLQADLEPLADVPETLADLALNAKTMTAAVMEALTQLNLSRTYEKRLANLEAAVFGKPD